MSDGTEEAWRASANATLFFLKSVLFPKDYQCAPPYYYNRTTMMQSLQVSGTWASTGTTDANNPEVYNTQGCILWFPMLSPYSVLRYGFVGAGTSVATYAVSNRSVYSFAGYAANSDATANGDPLYGNIGANLTFNQETAIPISGGSTQLTVGPAPSILNAVAARLVSGIVSLRSLATAIGSTTIGGQASYGVVADTRPVSSVSGQPAFAPSAISTESITSKEGAATFELTRGIVSIVGPDISSSLMPPAPTTGSCWGAANQRINLANFTSTSVASNTGATFMPVIFNSLWVTPCNTSTNGTFSGNATQIVQINPIDEGGTVNLEFSMKMSTAMTGPLLASTSHITIWAQSFYAQSQDGSSGSPYNILLTKQIKSSSMGFASYTNSTTTPVVINTPVSFRFDLNTQFQAAGGVSAVGKLIGVFVGMGWNVSGNASDTINCVFTLSEQVLSVEAPTANVPGAVGPCHVLEWRGLPTGQQVAVNGKMNTQIVPGTLNSSFVQKAVQAAPTGTNLSVIPLMSHLFDSSEGTLKRNWMGDEYDALVAKHSRNMSMEDVQEWAGKSSVAAGALHAAGVFGVPQEPTGFGFVAQRRNRA